MSSDALCGAANVVKMGANVVKRAGLDGKEAVQLKNQGYDRGSDV